MGALGGAVLKPAVRWLMRSLPPWRGLDRAFALAMFVHDNRRLPRVPPVRYYDLLYWIKTRCLDEPERARLTDKLLAKEHIRAVLGGEPCPRTLAVFRAPGEITAEAVPLPCVIKATHLSGRYLLLRAPPTPAELARIRGWLGENHYFRHSRERNYLHLAPGVIAEAPVSPPESLVDAKIFCLRGEPVAIHVITGRFHDTRRVHAFDPGWRLTGSFGPPRPGGPPPRPDCLGPMLAAAGRLAAPFPWLRVDCYLLPGGFLVGELTSLPLGGRHGSIAGEEAMMERAIGGTPVHRHFPGQDWG